MHSRVHTDRRIFEAAKRIWMLTLFGLVGDLNPLGRFENLSHNSLLILVHQGKTFSLLK